MHKCFIITYIVCLCEKYFGERMVGERAFLMGGIRTTCALVRSIYYLIYELADTAGDAVLPGIWPYL